MTARFTLRLDGLSLENQHVAVDAALIQVCWAGPVPKYGDLVELTGAVHNLSPPRNPGEFNFARYQERNGIYSECVCRFPSDCRIVGHGGAHWWEAWAIQSRSWIVTQLERDLEDSPEIAQLIESMVLGLRGQTPEEVKELFQRTGTMHLFAVSGLNVAMVAAITGFVLKVLRVGRRTAIALIIPVLAAYAVLTGLSASCVRATIMGVVILVAYLCDRRPILFNSLSAAAFAILAWNSNELFSPGFQFSFTLVVMIVWLSEKFELRLRPLGEPDSFLPHLLWTPWQKFSSYCSRVLSSVLGVTLAGWIGSLVFTAGYFHLFSPSAILANLFAVPLAFGIMGLGMFSIAAAVISPALSVLFNNANWAAAKLLLLGIEWCALIPGGHVYLPAPHWKEPPCEITVFDLGPGGAIHLRVEHHDWLLDCGSPMLFRQILIPYLRTRGINQLAGFLLTHGDGQHIGGALDLLAEYQPRLIVDSELRDRSRVHRAFHHELAARRVGKCLCERGDILRLSPHSTLEILYPPAGLQRALADDKTLVLRLEFEGVKVLFMSDSGFATEQWLLENSGDLRADLLIKGQHERDFSGSVEFLMKVGPQAIVCSAPAFGRSLQQLDTWEKNVSELGIEVFRQDRTGAVRVELSAGGFSMAGFANDQIFRSRAR